jgi:hypothetical protein
MGTVVTGASGASKGSFSGGGAGGQKKSPASDDTKMQKKVLLRAAKEATPFCEECEKKKVEKEPKIKRIFWLDENNNYKTLSELKPKMKVTLCIKVEEGGAGSNVDVDIMAPEGVVFNDEQTSLTLKGLLVESDNFAYSEHIYVDIAKDDANNIEEESEPVVNSAEEEEVEEEEEKKCFCGKEHIDLREKMTFAKQTQDANCKAHCDSIIKTLNIVSEGATGEVITVSQKKVSTAFYQVALENDDNTELIFDTNKLTSGMEYLDLSLEKGYPVIVGVNHTFGNKVNEYTTDHFVIIVGRYCEAETIYYRFWDVGSSGGASNDYKFQVALNGSLFCEKNYNNKRLDITQIRRNRELPANTLLDLTTLKKK